MSLQIFVYTMLFFLLLKSNFIFCTLFTNVKYSLLDSLNGSPKVY